MKTIARITTISALLASAGVAASAGVNPNAITGTVTADNH